MKTDCDSTNKSKMISDESMSSKISNESAVSSKASSSNGDHHHSTITTTTATTGGGSSKSSPLTNHNKKRIIDETLLPPDEAEKILTRRAYNRDCATRARKRNKQLVQQLEKQVHELQADKEELRRAVSKMENHILVLENQNKTLLLKQMLGNGTAGPHGSMVSMDRNNNLGLTAALQQQRQTQQSTAFLPPPVLSSTSALQQQHQSMFPNATAGGLDFAQANALVQRYMNGAKSGFY
jgi:regulator of replication initiation timing